MPRKSIENNAVIKRLIARTYATISEAYNAVIKRLIARTYATISEAYNAVLSVLVIIIYASILDVYNLDTLGEGLQFWGKESQLTPWW